MRWFEDHKKIAVGSENEVPGNSYRAIAKIADHALDGGEMIQFIREAFVSQKAFGEFLGVGESTVAGWIKSGSFPDYAKRATLAAYYAAKYHRLYKEAERDTARPKVVKDGDRYSIVQLKPDSTGVTVGQFLAKDIPTEKAALVFAGSVRAWEIIGKAEELIDHSLESMDPEHSEWIQDLKEEVAQERLRAYGHDILLERERKNAEMLEQAASLSLDDLFPDEVSGASANVEDKEGGKDA